MSMIRRCTSAALALIVVACGGGEPATESAAPVESSAGGRATFAIERGDAPAASGPRSPVDARLEAPDGTPNLSSIHLVWVVDRAAAIPAPVNVAVVLPPECRLLSGATGEQLASAPGESRGELLVACSSIPATDLVVSVDARSSEFGYHEDLHYRFGRPEPVAAPPQLGAMHVVVGGQDYGRPVLAQPTQADALGTAQ